MSIDMDGFELLKQNFRLSFAFLKVYFFSIPRSGRKYFKWVHYQILPAWSFDSHLNILQLRKRIYEII